MAQVPDGAKAALNRQSSEFDDAVDATRTARLAALEVSKEMRVAAQEEMKKSRSHRKRSRLILARRAEFIENCRSLGIEISDPDIDDGADQRQSPGGTSASSTGSEASETSAA